MQTWGEVGAKIMVSEGLYIDESKVCIHVPFSLALPWMIKSEGIGHITLQSILRWPLPPPSWARSPFEYKTDAKWTGASHTDIDLELRTLNRPIKLIRHGLRWGCDLMHVLLLLLNLTQASLIWSHTHTHSLMSHACWPNIIMTPCVCASHFETWPSLPRLPWNH